MPTIKNSRRTAGKRAMDKAKMNERQRLARLVKAKKDGPLIPDAILRGLQDNLPNDLASYNERLQALLKGAT